ncbi:tetraacyldisaccharide 4'-kinase [Salinicola socius]|uniref:Tetraacyldisaccharide 4'-kinase n=1 Tax=Salinicola socius TaxID=404433 RepID=A0A1Q8SQ67_9GAMM|nr:tetraacyldisaccharide 4'-kinase [Salinicola socius]OLO03544.1 tetraacyldisaccharide 4'-kinase [Salinicola socius]
MTPIERAWYRGADWLVLLAPLEALYRHVVKRRRQAYRDGRRDVWQPPVPVIVVGNLSVGGTGKSPLVAWLVRWLRDNGWRPGIVSRGYGGKAESYPLAVTSTTPVAQSGDEPLMLAQQTGAPVAVDPDRPQAARWLLEQLQCDILIADDGLQHYALGRALELVVVDGVRGFGNRHCLPRGPLREPLGRLAEVDALIANGGVASLAGTDGEGVPRFSMTLAPTAWRHLASGARYPIEPLPFAVDVPVVALAGIGHPQRFFDTLDTLGVPHQGVAFGDHHRYSIADLPDAPTIVVMTAKDAVKCAGFADERCWVLDVEATPEPAFVTWWAEQVDGWSRSWIDALPAGAERPMTRS